MAEKLDEFPGRDRSQYPWDEWLDGDPWLLKQGEDYECKTISMRSAATSAARRRDGKLRTQCPKGEDGERIIIQFIPDGKRAS